MAFCMEVGKERIRREFAIVDQSSLVRTQSFLSACSKSSFIVFVFEEISTVIITFPSLQGTDLDSL